MWSEISGETYLNNFRGKDGLPGIAWTRSPHRIIKRGLGFSLLMAWTACFVSWTSSVHSSPPESQSPILHAFIRPSWGSAAWMKKRPAPLLLFIWVGQEKKTWSWQTIYCKKSQLLMVCLCILHTLLYIIKHYIRCLLSSCFKVFIKIFISSESKLRAQP